MARWRFSSCMSASGTCELSLCHHEVVPGLRSVLFSYDIEWGERLSSPTRRDRKPNLLRTCVPGRPFLGARNRAILSALVSMGEDLLSRSIRRGAAPAPGKSCVWTLRRGAPPAGARLPARPERETRASPTGGIADRQKGTGGDNPADGLHHAQGPSPAWALRLTGNEVRSRWRGGQRRQRRACALGLLVETTNLELAALVRQCPAAWPPRRRTEFRGRRPLLRYSIFELGI
jgi:hypothetical protein